MLKHKSRPDWEFNLFIEQMISANKINGSDFLISLDFTVASNLILEKLNRILNPIKHRLNVKRV